MTDLGHERFAVVGHDRGSYDTMRIALDHPDRVTRVALLDCLPISEHLDRTDARFATAWWHWFFFAQSDVPDRIINADPDAGITAAPAPWVRRTTLSGGPRSTTQRWGAACWRAIGPGRAGRRRR